MALKLPMDQKILHFKAVKKINGFYSLCFFVGHCTTTYTYTTDVLLSCISNTCLCWILFIITTTTNTTTTTTISYY